MHRCENCNRQPFTIFLLKMGLYLCYRCRVKWYSTCALEEVIEQDLKEAMA